MRTVQASVEVTAPPSARIRQVTRIHSRLPQPLAWAHEIVAAAGARHGLRGAVAGAARMLGPGTIDAAGSRRRRGRR